MLLNIGEQLSCALMFHVELVFKCTRRGDLHLKSLEELIRLLKDSRPRDRGDLFDKKYQVFCS